MNTNTSKIFTFELTIEDVNLILETLGKLPFARVYSLIGRVQEQAQRQTGGTVRAVQDRGEGEGGTPAKVASGS